MPKRIILTVAGVGLLASSPAVAQNTKITPKPKASHVARKPHKPKANVYYQNCSAARAAGAAPIRRGEPGYARKLDRDGDGVACE